MNSNSIKDHQGSGVLTAGAPLRSRLAPMFSSASCHWPTPSAVYDALHAEFRFDFDPCPHGYDGVWSGTAQSWAGKRVYCNPPYGPGVDRWLAKAAEAELAVYLLPARTDTRWWHDYVMKADEIRFLRGRLKFGDAVNSAPFPSAVIVFRRAAETSVSPAAPAATSQITPSAVSPAADLPELLP